MNIYSNSQHNRQNTGAANQKNVSSGGQHLALLLAIQVDINVHQEEETHTAPVCSVSDVLSDYLDRAIYLLKSTVSSKHIILNLE
jgi:hypothetical protein